MADRLRWRWLAAPEHPLTARVTVNRLWQEFFGRGIVATSENFGVRGDRPSHPELLDWLATEFHRPHWSIKEMLRWIVISRTYRQSSQARPELAAAIPAMPCGTAGPLAAVGRSGCATMRLAVSGLLCRTVGGPSVKPPQPASVSKEAFRNLGRRARAPIATAAGCTRLSSGPRLFRSLSRSICPTRAAVARGASVRSRRCKR